MVKRVLLTTAVLFWMVIIFLFSAKPADESTKMSMSVGHLAGRVFVSEYRDWTQDKKDEFAEKIDHPVRKAAHGTEYMILGILLMGALGSNGLDGRKRAVIAFAAGTIYACSDELHQLFVPGRSCQITDVMIDSTGVAAGVLLWAVMSAIFSKRRKKKE